MMPSMHFVRDSHLLLDWRAKYTQCDFKSFAREPTHKCIFLKKELRAGQEAADTKSRFERSKPFVPLIASGIQELPG